MRSVEVVERQQAAESTGTVRRTQAKAAGGPGSRHIQAADRGLTEDGVLRRGISGVGHGRLDAQQCFLDVRRLGRDAPGGEA